MTLPHRLNAGCGRDVRPGWCNLNDRVSDGMVEGRDVVFRLGAPREGWVPFDMRESTELFIQMHNWFSFIELSHVLEHITPISGGDLRAMQTLWEVARHDAECVVRVPYGTSDDADEDPTHVRRMTVGRWGYYSQPYYWRASYGYSADWQPVTVVLEPHPRFAFSTDEAIANALVTERNVVVEMTATLRAVKPARPPERELQEPPAIVFKRD